MEETGVELRARRGLGLVRTTLGLDVKYVRYFGYLTLGRVSGSRWQCCKVP